MRCFKYNYIFGYLGSNTSMKFDIHYFAEKVMKKRTFKKRKDFNEMFKIIIFWLTSMQSRNGSLMNARDALMLCFVMDK